jgi:hypothetical protein
MSGIAVMTTAWRRPYYLERTLESWSRAAALLKPDRFVISLGITDRYAQQVDVIDRARDRFPVELEILHQSTGGNPGVDGPHRAIGEAGQYLFSDEKVEFLVFGEEDVLVSDDVLLYMEWARRRFAARPEVLTACAHSVGGMGWDWPEPAQDADADQQEVTVLPYFNPWCWGTWRDRWAGVLEPNWCWQALAHSTGYDWAIEGLMSRQYRSVVPEASRSQNIGELEGLYSTPASWSYSQAQSFREERGVVSYTLQDARYPDD